MMLICPACSTHYEVAEDKIPAEGRSVKCASCHHVWTAGPWNRGNYRQTEAFPQRRPVAPEASSPASRRSNAHSSYFSRPVTSVRGNAALAALFDERVIEEDQEVVEGRWEALAEKTSPLPAGFSIEERLEQALEANPVAKMQLERQKQLAAPYSAYNAEASPFRRKISETNAPPTANQAPPSPSRAVAIAPQLPQQVEPEEADSRAETPPPTGEPAQSLANEAGSALRTLAKIAVTAFNRAGDWLEGLIPKDFFTARPVDAPTVTPGDKQVSQWRARQRKRARNKMTPLRFIGWSVWSASLIGFVVSIFMFRTDIMSYWPETKSAYALIGLPAQRDPVTLHNISHRFALSNKGPVIELRGAIRHEGDAPVATPLIQADAYSADGDLLASWVFRTNAPRQMLPQMETPFLTRSLAPTGMTRIDMRLVPPQTVLSDRTIPMGQDETGQPAFFMQKTTGGWGAEQEAVPPSGS